MPRGGRWNSSNGNTYMIQYGPELRDAKREVWTVYKIDSDQENPFDHVAQRATIIALESFPMRTKVKIVDGIEYHASSRIIIPGVEAGPPNLRTRFLNKIGGDDLIELGKSIRELFMDSEAGQAPILPVRMPQKPPPEATLILWFDYYSQMKTAGFKYTLDDLANDSGYSPSHIRHEHPNYKRSKE